jgi:tetratricopeptide (TPR) repeat protein
VGGSTEKVEEARCEETQMSDLERLKRIVQQGGDLSKLGQDEDALVLLDEAITEAVRNNQVMRVRILSHHAAVTSDSIGDRQRVRHYFEQSLASNPNNSRALFGLAKALHREGKTELAKQYADKCYSVH